MIQVLFKKKIEQNYQILVFEKTKIKERKL